MCSACMIAATAGASGVRAWLQTRHFAWLTPRRMRALTITLVVAALAVSSVAFSSSSTDAPPRADVPNHSTASR